MILVKSFPTKNLCYPKIEVLDKVNKIYKDELIDELNIE